jgi:hypothetical protein
LRLALRHGVTLRDHEQTVRCVGHRQSVDFDFFGNRPFEPAKLATQLPFLDCATV